MSRPTARGRRPPLPRRREVESLFDVLEGAVAEGWGRGAAWRVAWAPARLDVMGGIADYSGSLVAQLPLAEGTLVAFRSNRFERIRLWSESVPRPDREFSTSTEALEAADSPRALRRHLTNENAPAWVAYPLGVWFELRKAGHLSQPRRGIDLVVRSSTTLGSGLASSAALEVATARALEVFCDEPLEGVALARLCQRAENRVVGAPCGVMDQIASALGRRDHLIQILCRPADVLGQTPLPGGVRLYGVDTGIQHSVGGSRYTRARVAAFMGHRILRLLLDPSGQYDSMCGYVTQLEPAEWRRRRDRVPARLLGSEFLARYERIHDPVTRVEPDVTYRVRAATEHPIREHQRVKRFLDRLDELAADGDPARLLESAGREMLASHRSYGRNCGLGSPEADWVVDRVRSLGPERGLYGARITGGGCGGTVAVLAGQGTQGLLKELTRELADQTGQPARLVSDSGPGAFEVPILRGRPG